MSVRRQIRKVSVEKVSLVFKFMGEGEYLQQVTRLRRF